MATRILLFTGKGGVGKTTCAAATALKLAQQGQRTLILSSDPAHSLADALDQDLGPEPREVADHLYAQEIDLYYSMQKYWGNVRQLMLTAFRWQGVEKIAAEEMAALPGMAEASALLWLEKFEAEEAYDVIVVDSAPTGETLSLLTLPQATQWWISRALPFQKTAIKTFGFGVRKTTGIPLDKGYEELDTLFGKLQRIQEVLGNPEVSTVRLVMNPERMVIREARRAYTYLQLYGYAVDAVIVNRILPEDELGAALQNYVTAQAAYLEEIEQSFAPLPILHVPHLGEEVFGEALLQRIADGMYAEHDPGAVLHTQRTFDLTADGDGYELALHLPFLHTETFEVQQYGDELVVQVHNQRRHYQLPNFLSYYTLTDTALKEDWLRARFDPPEDETLATS